MGYIKWYKYFLFFIFFESCDQEHKYDFFITRALEYEKEKNYEQALIQLNKAINIDSTKSFAFVFRGRMKSLLGNEYMAIDDYSKATKLDAKSITAYFHKGKAFSILQNKDSAIANFNKAINIKSSGNIYYDIKYNKFNDLETQIDIPMAVIRYYRAMSLYDIEKDSEALKDFHFSLLNKYEIVNCQFYIGVILVSNDQTKEGCLYLKKAEEAGDKEAIEYYSKYCK